MKHKRIISALLCAVICFSAVSCSDENGKPKSSGSLSGSTSSGTEETSEDLTQSQSETSADDDDTDDDPDNKSDVGLETSISLNSSWESDGKTVCDYTVNIRNNTDETVSGWKVEITNTDCEVVSAWSCSYEKKENNSIVFTPETYNSEIAPKNSVEFGVQLSGDDRLSSDVIEVSASEDVTGGVSVNTGGQQNNNNNNNNNQNNDSGSGGDKIINTGSKKVPEPSTDDWLSTDGSSIVDSEGNKVWLTGCNWFGYNTGTNCFDGLWACDLDSSLASIADHGFNLLRIPISTELVNNWEDGQYPDANYNNATNSYLNGMNSLEIFDHVIGQCRANGIKIMVDFHCALTDSMGHMKPMWYEGDVTTDDYYRALEWIADRYKKDDTIVAIDLENEPHGKQNESPRAKWDDSKDEDNWKYVAEQAAGKVLKKNPNLLVMVEGIEIYPKDTKKNGDFSSQDEDDYFFNWWGGNLRGVADNPVNLGKYQNKLVYSPHDYGPAVFRQPWFEGSYDYESLQKDCWYDNWFYIQDKKIAPLLIGEWGGFMTEPNLTWMTYLRKYIKENRINHTFWCFNANSGDTGGLVLDDFTTWDEEKYNFVKEVLWQKDGKFVGLDHKIPLGENGISLSEY